MAVIPPSSSVLVAQIGARRRYAVPIALHRERLLERLCTDFLSGTPLLRSGIGAWAAITGSTTAKRLLARAVTAIPASRVTEFPSLLLSQVLPPARNTGDFRHRVLGWVAKNKAFGTRVVRHGFQRADTVYGFNAAAQELFEAAKPLGIKCVLDQTNAGWQSEWNTRQQEHERWPDWEAPQPSNADIAPLIDREHAEWQLADQILCGSPYVIEQIATTPAIHQKCSVIVPGRFLPPPTTKSNKTDDSTLHVLFIGNLELRKGIQYFAKAANELAGKGYTFRAVGHSSLLQHRTASLSDRVEITGHVPHSDLPSHFAWADILVMPSISEGSAGVCTEALSHGLPVMATKESGSPVRHLHTGFIIPSGTHEAMVDCLRLAKKQPDLLHSFGVNIRNDSQALSIEAYGRNLRTVLTGS